MAECDATADELTQLGPGKCFAIPADMQKLSEVERLVSELERREKVLHVLVNNAGATWGESIDNYPVREQYITMHALRAHAHYSLLLACCVLFRGHGRGRHNLHFNVYCI